MHDRHDIGDVIRRAFCFIFCGCEGRDRTREVIRKVTYTVKGISFTTLGEVMPLQLTDSDVPCSVQVKIAFQTAKGNPAKVDGAPTWAASNPALIDSVTPDADGMGATFHVVNALDASNLTVTADVDLGSGVTNTDFVDTVSVVAGAAVAANFTFGTVTPDP